MITVCRLVLSLVIGLLGGLAQAHAFEVESGVEFASPDGESLRADIYSHDSSTVRPAVIVIHGGGWRNGEPSDMNRFAKELAGHGYVVMNITYRFAPANVYPAQLEDCRAALRWLRSKAQRYRVDPNRIGVFGYSAGGHLALMMGLVSSADPDERVQAVVGGAGPTDLRWAPDSAMVNDLLGGGMQGRESVYAAASPVWHVSEDDPPVFLFHGRRDLTVKFEHAIALHEMLLQVGVPTELAEAPFGHVLTYFFNGGIMQRALKFLDLHIGAPE